MRQLIEYFDRAYIINLIDRHDRRRETTREFQRIGINIPSEKAKFYSAIRPLEKGGFSSAETRGCFISHRNVLELAYRDGQRNLLVFEDDVAFMPRDTLLVRRLISELSRIDWDIVYFGYNVPSRVWGPDGLLEWPRDTLGAFFYAIHGRFIPRMLEYMYKCEMRVLGHPAGGPMPADGAYNHIRYLETIRALISVPTLGYQRSSRSDITPKWYDGIEWLRPFISSVVREAKRSMPLLRR